MHSSPHGCHVTELKREAFAFLIPRISRLTCWFMWQCVCELYSWSQCVNIHTDLNMLTSTSCFFPHTVCTCKNKHSVDVRSLYFDTCCIKWRRDSLLPRSSDMELIVNNTEGIFLFCFVLFFKQEALRHDNNRKVNKSSYHSKQIHGYLDLMLTSIVNNMKKQVLKKLQLNKKRKTVFQWSSRIFYSKCLFEYKRSTNQGSGSAFFVLFLVNSCGKLHIFSDGLTKIMFCWKT